MNDAEEPNGASGEPNAEPADEQPTNDGAGSAEPSQTEPSAEDTEEWRRSQHVFNTFFGSVNIGQAQFGFGSEQSGRRKTGPFTDQEVESALENYVKPAGFDTARRTLFDQHVVVLLAPPATGKRVGAIALLQSVVPDAPIVGLSPALSTAELASYGFRPGRGYIVQDRLPEVGEQAVLEFEGQALIRKLSESGAYLVITATGSPQACRSLRSQAREWRPPDPVALFDRYVKVELHSSDRDRVLERVRRCPSPRDVVVLAQLILEYDYDVEAALESLAVSERGAVLEWFDDEPPQDKVLFIAALAFAHGLPERLFELELSRLVVQFDHPDAGEDTNGLDRPLLQERRIRRSATGLAKVIFQLDPEFGDITPEHRLVFEVPSYRVFVIEELWNRYDRQLWDPVAAWVRDLALTSPEEVRMQVALGVAVLARVAGNEVEESFLKPWSCGTLSERLTAAYVLWWFCADDTLAPLALRISLGWVRSGDPRRMRTAALTLAGELGVRYTGEALRALWRLAVRGDVLGGFARLSIAQLFSNLVQGPANGSAVLRFLDGRLRHSAAGTGRGPFDARCAFDTMRAILSMRVPGTAEPEPVVGTLLRTRPEDVGLLGALWADTLRSRPHRAAAVDSLRKTLESLSVRDGLEPVIRSLGDAIAAALPPVERMLLKRDLLAELSVARGAGMGRASALAAALLAAFEDEQGRDNGHA
jgi:hypothetical protein